MSRAEWLDSYLLRRDLCLEKAEQTKLFSKHIESTWLLDVFVGVCLGRGAKMSGACQMGGRRAAGRAGRSSRKKGLTDRPCLRYFLNRETLQK